MMSTVEGTTYETATTEWLDILRSTIQELVEQAQATGDLDGVTYSMCETYTDVPRHISPQDRVAWHLRIADGKFTFEPIEAEADDVDTKVVGEWEVIDRMARILLPDDGSHPPEVQAMLGEAVESGRLLITNTSSATPPPLLSGVHNAVARRTGAS